MTSQITVWLNNWASWYIILTIIPSDLDLLFWRQGRQEGRGEGGVKEKGRGGRENCT